MPVTYRHALRFMGQPVIAHCHHGKYYGIVRKVTRDGIWLEPLPRTAVPASAKSKEANIATADRPESPQGENVYFAPFFAPFFFLPFFVLLALTPFFFWW